MKSAKQIEDYIRKYDLPIEVEVRGTKYRAFGRGTPVTSWISGDEMYTWLKGYDIGFVDGWDYRVRKEKAR